MKYGQFVGLLEANPEKELVFEFDHGAIRRDYHITEVFNVNVTAIDCGGALDHWGESVLQLVEPGEEDGERFMESKKALGILKKSHEKISLDPQADVLLEYRPESASAAQRYHVSEVIPSDNQLRVLTAGTTTQCKAAGRNSEASQSACCGPDSKEESKTKPATACCPPGGKPSSGGNNQKSACC